MVYGMGRSWTGLILIVFIFCSAGCTEAPPAAPPAPAQTPIPAPIPSTVALRLPQSPSDMALQPSDLPSEYLLRDRSVMALPEVSQIGRSLGWRQGYFVSFYRVNSDTGDFTRILQSISVFSPDNINGVFLIEKDALKDRSSTPGTRYEIPFPPIGDRSIAFRETNPVDPDRPVTYTVIFTKKNVFEKITMSGTLTDYETLKRLAQRAETLIE